MNLSTWSIRNPVPPIALFVVLCVAGLVSFSRLPVTEMPNVDLPVVLVDVAAPGTAPSEIASQVIQPIETAVSDIAGLRHIEAIARDGGGHLTIQFEFGTNTDRALNDVKDAVTSARSQMPDTASDPVVQRLDFTGRPILTYAVADQTRSIEELSTFVDDVVARALQGADGVGSVSRLGGADREIRVDLDPDRLLALNLTASSVSQQLAQTNLDQGGGQGDLFGAQYAIRALGSALTLDQLAETPIRLPTGDTVRLNQLGTVTDGASEATSFALYNGRPVVAFGVFRATGASDLVAAASAEAKLDELRALYPDTEFSLIDDATVHTEATFESAMETLYEGALLAIIVVFLFLRDWRATIVALIALPLSAIPTFIVMDLLGFSLNTISLLGITLVVGILVDDAIVEIENIVRHIHMGRRAYEAAMEAATEIGTTVIAISMTIVAVFAPVSFMGGVAGEFFKQFGLTVAVAVLFSLAVARLITPLFAAYFMKSKPDGHAVKDGVIMRTYLRTLGWTLRNRTITLIFGLLIFGASIYSATLLPQEFIPESDTGRAAVAVELPPGTTIAEARAAGLAITRRILEVPEVRRAFVDGSSATSFTVQVNYGDKSERSRDFRAINADLERHLADLPDMRLYVLAQDAQRDITINVLADTEAGAAQAAGALLSQMRALPLIRHVSSEAALLRPEIQITPDPERAAELGVTSATLASAIRIATIGDLDTNLAQFDAGDERIPIRVRLNEATRTDVSRLIGFRVPSARGTMVPLGAIAEVRLSSGVSVIERYDRRYRVSIQADLAPGAYLGPATAAIEALPAATHMPDGTEIQPSGDVETMKDIFSSFALAMGSGLMLVYVVLVLLFNSFITPLTIMLSLPLAIGGAIFALYLYGSGIGLSVVIGFLMLMGIVTKNAIMLVEFALEGVKGGMDRATAMIDAGHKRARPIVMTTIAMAAGMVPSALGTSSGGEFRAPMAIAVIGGLLLSTALSLLFVPSVFSVLEGLKDRMRRLLQWMLGGDSLSSHRRH
ncbi:MAG: efflux RND transporter permease subunit [Rhodobacter sp.]|uniref:efflux RND transporter permease subunit n=1 Tax=Pararhodobacter sp. TaxID=2127056 RepID=UPI001DD42686|nr:efflux RND transporter permease subunit [Pararhodobacter sp.]MCB1344688.1 efflux RND transporter permease subunit [Paracoccaceae bacterium]MCC0074360.1 efflux RND transporter permease subunit [Rhodobacter sp.]HPD91263.1 efflux RND transporter permease subunit [Pararhodobacter sp.]